MIWRTLSLGALMLLSACTVGPDYVPPVVETPTQWRVSLKEAGAYAFLEWWKSLQDPQLNQLIETALRENQDLKMAVARIEEHRAILGVKKSALFPAIDLSGNATHYYLKKNALTTAGVTAPSDESNSFSYNASQMAGSLSYEIDFWGKIRRQGEVAFASLMAQEENRQNLILSLVTNVAQSYIGLLALDHQLQIVREVHANRIQNEKLIRDRFRFGLSSDLELKQAESETALAAEQIPLLEKNIAQKENALSILLGHNPQAIPRGRSFKSLKKLAWKVPSLPSTLLKRRPDIRQAENLIKANNAEIGVAMADYFPQVNLVGVLGLGSIELRRLFDRRSFLEKHAASFSLPLLNAGRIEENVNITKARHQQALISYAQTVQVAFQEVEDSLIDCQKTAEQEKAKRQSVESLSKTLQLAKVRYLEGISSYLDVAGAENQLLSARLSLVDVETQAFLATINLYKALGNGWEKTSLAFPENAQAKGRKG